MERGRQERAAIEDAYIPKQIDWPSDTAARWGGGVRQLGLLHGQQIMLLSGNIKKDIKKETSHICFQNQFYGMTQFCSKCYL